MALRAFHYSFLVKSLDEARTFYSAVLGCREGRSAPTWVDFDFFGNQLSLHQADDIATSRATGEVDGVRVPMPHFGAIVSWNEFADLADRVRDAGVAFVIPPTRRFVGKPGEQALMFFRDPSGNALEIKSFLHPDAVFDGA